MLTKVPDVVHRASRKLSFHARSLTPRQLPPLADGDAAIVQNLRQQGVYATSLAAMGIPHANQFLTAVDGVVNQLPPTSSVTFAGERSVNSHCVGFSAAQMLAHPDIFAWGLQQRWLNLAENYLRQPAAYLGCVVRHDAANQAQVGIRLWHQDAEDYKVLKVLIYLNDVDEMGGPFEYIPRQQTPSYQAFRHLGGLIKDDHMAQVVPRQQWQSCVGPRGTALLMDAANIFHHATVPHCDRASITFAYTTATPKNKAKCESWCPQQDNTLWKTLQAKLTPRQKVALVGWR